MNQLQSHENNHIHEQAIGVYTGVIAPNFNDGTLRAQLEKISDLLQHPNIETLSSGSDYVVKVPMQTDHGEIQVAIKIFKRQRRLKDYIDRKNKTKAERSYNAARHLETHNIGTPPAIAWFDYWQHNRLLESYYVCVFQPSICLRDALNDIYQNSKNNEPLMALLHLVAPAIKAMHDANFIHGDMGNQNILLPINSDNSWGKPQFIDLNRCTIKQDKITDKERAFDLSRIALPANYFNFFKYIYCEDQMPSLELEMNEQTYRKRFSRHQKSRKFRHPIQHFKMRNKKQAPDGTPDLKDYWLWDEKSAQPMITLSRKQKNSERYLANSLLMLKQGLIALPKLYAAYKQTKQQSFMHPINLKGRIGVALHPQDNYIEHEKNLLNMLGNPPVLIRFCHHENRETWQKTIELIQGLHADGIEVMVALLQDRQAVLHPERWQAFLNFIIPSIFNQVSHIEITHAFNRIKWGVWNIKEWQALMTPAFEFQKQFPHIKLTGPACIDFEYLPVIAAIKSLGINQKFSALSHLLYVDRRGAPENPQGPFSTLEKCALLKALTTITPQCDAKVIISEVNWPAENAGIWSPITSPHVTPNCKHIPSGESEENYANYMLRYIVIAICSGHIEQLFWWRLSAKGYGLVDDQNEFSSRAAFHALRHFFALLGKATFIKKWPSDKHTYIMEFHTSTQQILMLWNTQNDAVETLGLFFQMAYDRDGNSINSITISESPIYLASDLKSNES